MPIDTLCEGCGKTYIVPDDLAGRQARCKGCGNIMRVPADGIAAISLAGLDAGSVSLRLSDAPPSGIAPIISKWWPVALTVALMAFVFALTRPRFGVVEILLILGLISVIGVMAFLLFDSTRSILARKEEAKARRSAFREILVRELRSTSGEGFDFDALVESCEVTEAEATTVADEIYGGLAARVVADGIVTVDEQARLDRLAKSLAIDPTRATRIVSTAKDSHYREKVSEVLADGVVTPLEVAQLEALRRSFGISRGMTEGVTGSITRDAYLAILRDVVAAGGIDSRAAAELDQFKQGMALGDADAARMIRGEANKLFDEAFTSVLQDGVVTPDEEEMLNWLRREIGLSGVDYEPFRDRLERAKWLAGIRAGRLPSVRTAKLLEGGETCHWDSPCRLQYQTTRQIIDVSGELIVTSKRLIFSSPAKTFTYPPWKILDIAAHRSCLHLKVEARTGTGIYFVGDPEALEAVLVGVARKTKYLATEGYSSSATRHIPGDVKREVWDRDGGQCVQCGASGRGACLEYDHIIPHARGGANTTANVQLLCRPCNAAKSDRI